MTDGLDFVDIVSQHVSIESSTQGCHEEPEAFVEPEMLYTTGDLVRLQLLIDIEIQRRYDEERQRTATNEGFYQDDDDKLWGRFPGCS